MGNILEIMKSRRSVRTFDECAIVKQDKEKICSFMEHIENPYGVQVDFKLLEGMSSPVIVGTDLYVGAKVKKNEHQNEATGYSFEKLVLYAQSLGIGTTWIGGTMDRPVFEEAMELSENEIMPCVSPLGYPAKKMSMRETMMRKGINADVRFKFEELMFCNDFTHALTEEGAGNLYEPLEAVRLAPSAVNKQPWRIVVADNMVHFYLKRSKGFAGGELDMQKIDMGIALSHFELMAKEKGIHTEFVMNEPDTIDKGEMEYIASYKVIL